MTTGERLAQIAGATGSAGALLMMIGTGTNAGEMLVDWSKLSTGTAMEHLMADGGGSYDASGDWFMRMRRLARR